MASIRERNIHLHGPSKFEKAIGIEDSAFRTYLGMHNIDTQTHLLRELSTTMAQHAHPVVQSAAGWAVAEVALRREGVKGFGRSTFARRLDLLDSAKALWTGTVPLYESTINDTESPEVAARLLGVGLRDRQATAYQPAMQLAAYWFSGLAVNEAAIRKIREQTKEGILALASDVIDLPGEGSEFNRTRGGMCSELLVGALINDDPHSRYLIIPGSLRQDNNFKRTSRADLVAIDTHIPHRRIRIQITANGELTDEESGRVVIKANDLLLDPKDFPRTLLRKYVEKEKGVPHSPTDLAWLDMLPITLADQLDAYAARQGWN